MKRLRTFPTLPVYFPKKKLQKKAKEWKNFMLKSKNFKPQINKFTKVKSVTQNVQNSIDKWSNYIDEMEKRSPTTDDLLLNKCCSEERRKLLKSLPNLNDKLSILEKQIDLACNKQDVQSTKIRSIYLQDILKKENDQEKNKAPDENSQDTIDQEPDQEKNKAPDENSQDAIDQEPDFYFSFEYPPEDEIFIF